MKYTILNDNPDIGLLDRLLQIRNVDCDVENFFNPALSHYWIDPFLLSGMADAIERIAAAILAEERIMVFGDYDVDGVTSSYILFHFITKYLKYSNISIMYPHRRHDGYGLKNKHIDQMKEKGIGLIITVDNGITSIPEAQYAKQCGIDLIITDHHEKLPELPEAIAVINPHASDNYPFKGLCGAGVVFKLINAIMQHNGWTKQRKTRVFEYFLPIVALATVADCVPLVDENRSMVQKGLDLINKGKMPPSFRTFVDYLNIKGKVKSYHFGFLLGPRINAGGRINTPYDSLNILLYSGEKQTPYLERLEELNTERKQLQDDSLKKAKENLDTDQKIIFAASSEFHEGVVGIVAGRLTEEFYRPTAILAIDEEKGQASGSLRAPEYFSVIAMLHDPKVSQHVERSGGHKQAGGLTVKLENLEKLVAALQQHCNEVIKEEDLERNITVDTKLYTHDITNNHLRDIEKLAPFGVGNQEPLFLLQDVTITSVDKVGRKGNGHVKLNVVHGEHKLQTMFWRKGGQIDSFNKGPADIIGSIQADDFNGGRQLVGQHHIPSPSKS